jgi:hypothetical protein
MDELIKLAANPVVWKVLGAYWLFSAAVGAMKTPTEHSAEWYQFLFRFGHALSGNLNRAAVAFKVPGAKEDQP